MRRMIRNRDVILMSRVLGAMQDIRSAEEIRMKLQDRLWNITRHITGMPGGRGEPKGLDESFAAISEIEERYTQKIEALTRDLREAEDILRTLPESMQTFVVARYILALPDAEIQARLNIGRWRYEKLCERVEQAERMAEVDWPERFTLKENFPESPRE